MEKHFSDVQSALDISINAVTYNELAESQLGHSILSGLNEAQERLSSSGENALMVTYYFNATIQDILPLEKQIPMMEYALTELNEAIRGAGNKIKTSFDLAEANALEENTNTAQSFLPEDDGGFQTWLNIPYWVKQIFSCKEDLPFMGTEEDIATIAPEKLSNLRGAFIKAYAKVTPIIIEEYITYKSITL